jgi:epoxyqueuosine reductase
VKKRLKRLARWLIEDAGGEVKVFVDTAPVPEKPLAQAAGLGWQGKHTNLVSRELGSWFFIGSVFTTLEIETDPAEVDHCGSCRACLDVCPTDAFPAPYQLDARRCISYLTIEHKGPVDAALRPLLGNRIYGCDDCLAVCPWNKFAVEAREAKYHARADLVAPPLEELAGLGEAGFRARFSGSPIKRIGWLRFLRNVLYAIGNSGDARLCAVARAHLGNDDAAVADAARWALERLEQ